MEKTYYELHLPTAGFDTDQLSGSVFAAGALGVLEESDDNWIVYLPEEWQPVQIEQFLARLKSINADFDLEKVTFDKQLYQDWNAEWRKHFTPLMVTDKVCIRPPWHEISPDPDVQELIIDPQMAFGTGHHETTKLMIQAMSGLSMKNLEVLDLGTGSGILAIFSRMLGAKKALGIDIDPDAIDNARHNTELNKVDNIDYAVGDISDVEGQTFSVILANIQYHVLSKIALQLYNALEVGGILVVSGLLIEDVNRLSFLYKQAGLVALDRLSEKEWSAIIWEKKHAKF